MSDILKYLDTELVQNIVWRTGNIGENLIYYARKTHSTY